MFVSKLSGIQKHNLILFYFDKNHSVALTGWTQIKDFQEL